MDHPQPLSAFQEEEGSNEEHQQQQEEEQRSIVTYRLNVFITDYTPSDLKDDVCSATLVLLIFWCFACVTLIFGFYGSLTLQLGPNCSRLIQTNSVFVQSIKVEEVDKQKPLGLAIHKYDKPPPLDSKLSWTETHNAFLPITSHKEWLFYLNQGSKLNVSYRVISPNSSPLSLVVAQGRESLLEWIHDPSYPNTTLSWSIVFGSGMIEQDISMSDNYYIALGNLNSEQVEVELKFKVEALTYNTSKGYNRCPLGYQLCYSKVHFLETNAIVLTSPGRTEGILNDPWFVKVSFGPRWIIYFLGSGVITILVLLAIRFCNMTQSTRVDGRSIEELRSEEAPLLSHKDDDNSSWGSSYDSVSQDEDNVEDMNARKLLEGEPSNNGEDSSNPQHVCVICCDAPRDYFFLPCGHCAACFACGTRIAEEAGVCPICRRKTRKVRRVFTV